MIEPQEITHDLQACLALIRTQAATIAELQSVIETQRKVNQEQAEEIDKLRKLMSYFVNGHRSEKRILAAPDQNWLPFENSEEFAAARAEAEAQAKAVIQKYTVERTIQPKKRRDESLPSHLRREEQVIEADATVKTCATHGERKLMGYDTTETLVSQRPELFVLVKKYPKYMCFGYSECGVKSPERPTSLAALSCGSP